MNLRTLQQDNEARMRKALTLLQQQLTGLRTGRAQTSLLEHVKVECYGSMMPLKQVASLSVPEPRQIVIQVWDPAVLPAVEKAIQQSDLGLVPNHDGKVIRIGIPQLTEERRQELVKLARRMTEEIRVAIRNIRREANEGIKKLEKDKAVTEDDSHLAQDAVQKLTDQLIKQVDGLLAQKEKEIVEV